MKKPRKCFRKHRTIQRSVYKDFKRQGCEVIQTKRTMQVITADSKYMMAPEHLSSRELNLIQQIQREAKKWQEEQADNLNGYWNEKILYKKLHLDVLKRSLDSDIYAFDLKAAYPTFMYNKKIISQKTWNQFFEKWTETDLQAGKCKKEQVGQLIIPKERRQWLIGSIATTKYKSIYMNGKEVSHECMVKPTRIVWHYICYEVDRFMRKLFTMYRKFKYKKHFSLCYYWDCLFVLCNEPEIIEEFIKEFSSVVFKEGYTFGYSKLKLINFDLFAKKITMQMENGYNKNYYMTENGFYHPAKLVEGT